MGVIMLEIEISFACSDRASRPLSHFGAIRFKKLSRLLAAHGGRLFYFILILGLLSSKEATRSSNAGKSAVNGGPENSTTQRDTRWGLDIARWAL
jgi:hypothetical protein